MSEPEKNLEEFKNSTSDLGRSFVSIGKEIWENEKMTNKEKIIIIICGMILFSILSAILAILIYKF